MVAVGERSARWFLDTRGEELDDLRCSRGLVALSGKFFVFVPCKDKASMIVDIGIVVRLCAEILGKLLEIAIKRYTPTLL